MSKVGVATRAFCFRTQHQVAVVLGRLHRIGRDRLPITRPARAGIELVRGTEQGRAATDALIGADKLIPTLDGEITLKVPAGTKHGTILRVKAKGVPHIPMTPGSNSKARGDLFVRISVQMPDRLSKEAKKLIEELKKEGL